MAYLTKPRPKSHDIPARQRIPLATLRQLRHQADYRLHFMRTLPHARHDDRKISF